MKLVGISEEEWSSMHRALYVLMSGISEDQFKAQWITGNEFMVWDLISHPNGAESPFEKGRIEVIKLISKLTNGWIIWCDDENVAELDPELWGPRFVTLDEWRDILNQP